MEVAELARTIDYTLLRPEATPEQIDRLCDQAVEHRFCSVFVNPCYVERAVGRVEGSDTVVGTVAGFPLGASAPEAIPDEARRGIEAGAREIDMVIWVGGLIAGERDRIVQTIRNTAAVVHGAGPRHILKVILETAALSEQQTILGCRCCVEGGADFVKTSTGFHAAGGATVQAVALLHRQAAPLKVKASGGIRTLDAALAMIDAGASRIGTSAAVSIVAELQGRGPS